MKRSFFILNIWQPLLLALVLSWGAAQTALAGGVVTNLTQADLQAALVGGGSVKFATNGTLLLTSTIQIAQDTALDANGYTVRISGGGSVGLFQVSPGTVFQIQGLVLADGRVVGTNGAPGDPPGPGQDASGAAILNQGGTVALTGCILTNNSVLGGNAGTPSLGYGGSGGGGFGGALGSFGGQLNLTNCSLVANSASGGLESNPSSGFGTPGNAGIAFGGAIYAVGAQVNLKTVILQTNYALGGAGQPFSSNTGPGGEAAGGGIFVTNSGFYMWNSILTNNSALGGSIASGQNGYGAGSALGGGLYVSQDSFAVVQGSSFQGNSVTGADGRKYAAAGSGFGGGAFVAGQLRVFDSTFSRGVSLGGGSSIPPGIAQGGGIYSTNRLEMSGCTFDNNLAQGGTSFAAPFGINNGGDAEGGGVWSSGVLLITNSTFAGNSAFGGPVLSIGSPGAGRGGAVCVSGSTATLVNVTIAGNTADGTNRSGSSSPPGPSEGGGLFVTNGLATTRNSIVANSLAGGDVWGTVTDGGYNICSDGTANFSTIGSMNQADPLVSALSYNGGPTATMALLVGSPARDAIPSGFPPVDQRGVSRPQGPAADTGAFEADFVSGPPTIATQPRGGTVRAGTNFTFTVAAAGPGPLSYEWYKDGSLIASATASSLSLTNVEARDGGTYSVIVTNASGSAPTQGAVLIVDSTPLILLQPSSVVVSVGASTNFLMVADGPSLAYQWWHDNGVVPGATQPNFQIGSAMGGAQGNYFAVVSNFAGVVISAVAILTFDGSALSILVNPKDQTVEAGYPVTFSVVISGVPPFTYQWLFNGNTIPGASTSSFTLGSVNATNSGGYSVVVSNDYREVSSTAAQLVVTPGATPPQLFVAKVGGNLTITFNAEAGRSYRLLESTNLVSWSVTATNTAATPGPLQFVQSLVPGSPMFYRVVIP